MSDWGGKATQLRGRVRTRSVTQRNPVNRIRHNLTTWTYSDRKPIHRFIAMQRNATDSSKVHQTLCEPRCITASQEAAKEGHFWDRLVS